MTTPDDTVGAEVIHASPVYSVSSSPKLPAKVRSKEGLTVQASPVNSLAKVTPTRMEKMLMLSASWSAMTSSHINSVVIQIDLAEI